MIPDPGGGENVSSEKTTTPAMGGGSKRMRTFAEILHEEQNNRNILEVKISRASNRDGLMIKPLNEEDISEFLFNIVGLKAEDCVGIALRTHRHNTKEIKLKKNVDPSAHIRLNAVEFKDHFITIQKQTNNVTRVTFKNVPMNIPDEEIIHHCKVYGEPVNNEVHYERPSARTRGVPGSTRYVMVKMKAGKQFENYY